MIKLSGLVTLPAIHRVGRNNIVEDAEPEVDPENPSPEEEGRMSKAKLMSVHKNAAEVYNMIGDNENLEPWVQDKITKAADYINSVYNHLQYEKNRPAAIGQGGGSPAQRDSGMDTTRTVRTV
jgi:hypothetical protein